jgi:asparagine synthase (glutamine-hydrolysing)
MRIAGIWTPGTPLAPVADGDGPGAYARAWSDGHALHLARDPIGHRSLFWARRDDGTVAFASSVGLLDAPMRLNRDALPAYLSCAYVPGEVTLLEGVHAVSPGVELTVHPVGTERTTTWSLPASAASHEPEDALRAALRRDLEDAVDRALPDGPVAASLSGGIDSSLVVALAARRRRVTTLSITFGPEHRDELAFSSAVAKHVGAEHRVITVTPSDVAARFDATVAALSEPNGDPLTVPNAMLFEAAADLGGVLLNGEGGDPSFGGPKNAPMLLSELYGDDDPLALERAYLLAHQKCWDELDAMLGPGPHHVESLVTPWLQDPRWPAYLDKLMAINVAWKGAWHILPKVDALSAPYGVLARSPLFDRAVVERAFALPPSMKRNGPIEKYLLKEAVRDLLPAAIVDRPKSGMMVPVEAWFDGPLRSWARERLIDGLGAWDVIDRGYLERLADRRLAGLRPRRGVKLWLLLTLESWLRARIGSPR